MNNPFNKVNRVDITTDEVTSKVITYTYTDQNGKEMQVVREPNTKGRPRVKIEQGDQVYLLVEIETKYPKEDEAVKKVIKNAVVAKEEKSPLEEERVAVTSQEEVRTELVYNLNGKYTTVKAGRARPKPRLDDGSVLVKRIKYILEKAPKAPKAPKERVKKEKVPVEVAYSNVEKPHSVFVYSDGTELSTLVRGKGAPRKVLENGATLEKIVKMKPAPKLKKSALKQEEEEPLVTKEYKTVPITDLKQGDKFYRLKSLDNSVDYDLGILTIEDTTPEYVKYSFSPVMICGKLETSNTVRGSMLSQKVVIL